MLRCKRGEGKEEWNREGEDGGRKSKPKPRPWFLLTDVNPTLPGRGLDAGCKQDFRPRRQALRRGGRAPCMRGGPTGMHGNRARWDQCVCVCVCVCV